MAKKKVFKGVINGQAFNNVQEYNTRMNELIASGEDIEASSQTSIQDVEDVEDVCTGENCDTESFVNMLPGFNPRSDKGNFLNELVTNNPNLDEENFAKVCNFHKTNLPKMINKIQNMDYHALMGYLNDINVVLSEIKNANDIVAHNDTNVRNNIKQLQQELKDINRCYRVIEEYEGLYYELKSQIESRMNTLNTSSSKPVQNILGGIDVENLFDPEVVKKMVDYLKDIVNGDNNPFSGKSTR